MPSRTYTLESDKMITTSDQISDFFSEDSIPFYLPSGSSDYDRLNLPDEGKSMHMAFNHFDVKVTPRQLMEQTRLPRSAHSQKLVHKCITSDKHLLSPGKTDSDCIPHTYLNGSANTRPTIMHHSGTSIPRSQDTFQEYSTSSERHLQSVVSETHGCQPCTEDDAHTIVTPTLLFSQSPYVISFEHKQQPLCYMKRTTETMQRVRHSSAPATRPQPVSIFDGAFNSSTQRKRNISGANITTKIVTFDQHSNGSHTINGHQTTLPMPTRLVGTHRSERSVNQQSALDIQDTEGDTYLMILLIRGDIAKAEEIIHDYATNLNLLANQNAQGLTALMISVIKNQPNVVKSIVSLGATLDIPDYDNNTALHHACKLGNARCAKYIVTAIKKFSRKNPNLKDIPIWKNKNGDDCLALAVKNSRLDILDILVEQCGIDINTREAATGNTALHTAVQNQDINLVNHLLGYYRSEVQVDKPRYDGCTPLQLIYHKDGPLYVHIKSLLLEAGAKVGNFSERAY